MRVNEYKIMDDAVENGILWGIRRWQKHKDNQLEPEDERHLQDELQQAIMGAICESFIFDDDEDVDDDT